MERFNSCSYFYYIDNGIDPSTIMVDLSRLLSVVAKGQSHVKLLEKL